eukprot:m.112264 g.112264  ORF g.112264 m.112264 type:complete len:67 (-) comp9250_c0_seq2:300-500(-)
MPNDILIGARYFQEVNDSFLHERYVCTAKVKRPTKEANINNTVAVVFSKNQSIMVGNSDIIKQQVL